MVFNDYFVAAYTAAHLDEVQHRRNGRGLARAQRLSPRAFRARRAADHLL
jgi:hypothetical protein